MCFNSCRMNSNVFYVFVGLSILSHNFTESRVIRRKKLLIHDHGIDYEASGDYFEVTVNNFENVSETTTKKTSETSADDGVTCSQSNFTDILAGYELENHVLIVFKVNITASERELVLFLNLAKRFSDMRGIFHDHRFVVVTSDNSSEQVLDFIEKEAFPPDIVVVDEDEFMDFGFVVDLDELHVFVVDQCGRLAYIVVPPWSSAQYPYVKAAIISAIIDLPCGCPSTEFASTIFDASMGFETQTESSLEQETTTATTRDFSEGPTSETITYLNVPVIDIDTDEVENIEDLLDNANSLNHSPGGSLDDINLPLRIVIPSIHMHFDASSQQYWKYDQFVLKTDNQSYHEHLQNGEMLLEIRKDKWNLRNITSLDDIVFVGNRSLENILTVAQAANIFVDRVGKSYKIHKQLVGSENIYEMIPVEFDIVKVTPVQQIFGVRHHYEQLNRWLMFKV